MQHHQHHHHHQQQQQPNKRRVHFSTETPETHVVENFTNFDDTTQEELFSKRPEIARMKMEAKRIADRVYDEADQNSYAGVIRTVYASCCSSGSVLSADDRDLLSAWVRAGECWRGLERWCIYDHDADRRTRRQRVLRMVTGPGAKERSAGMLADMSKLLSEPATRFARVLGEADAAAIAMERQEDQVKDAEERKRQAEAALERAQQLLEQEQAEAETDMAEVDHEEQTYHQNNSDVVFGQDDTTIRTDSTLRRSSKAKKDKQKKKKKKKRSSSTKRPKKERKEQHRQQSSRDMKTLHNESNEPKVIPAVTASTKANHVQRQDQEREQARGRQLKDSYVLSRSQMMVRSYSRLRQPGSRRHLMQLGKASSFNLY